MKEFVMGAVKNVSMAALGGFVVATGIFNVVYGTMICAQPFMNNSED